MAEHSPGRVVYDADWRELKLEENGCVIATLPAPHPACRGKERIEDLATIKANGERLAALWNAASGVQASASAEPQDCPQCGNAYLAIRTDIHKDKREFVYCDTCGCLADRRVWNRITPAHGVRASDAPDPRWRDELWDEIHRYATADRNSQREKARREINKLIDARGVRVPDGGQSNG